MSKTLLEVKDLSVHYGKMVALEHINFTLGYHDYLAIVGPNGSGKTTLMRALLGLNDIASGEFVFGEGFSKKEIGYLPQKGFNHDKHFPASVYEIIQIGLDKVALKQKNMHEEIV